MASLDPRRGTIELVPKGKRKRPVAPPARPQGHVSRQPKTVEAVRLDDTLLANKIAEQVIKQLTNLLPLIQEEASNVPSSVIQIDASVIDIGVEEKEIKEGEFSQPLDKNNAIVSDKSLTTTKGKLKEALRGKSKRAIR